MPFTLNDVYTHVGDPQLTFQWELVLPPALTGAGPVAFHAQSVTLPFQTIEANDYHVANTKQYDPGFVDVDQVQMELVEDIEGKVTDFMDAWQGLVVDQFGFYGHPDEYKHPVVCHYLNPKGERTSLRHDYEGCWPVSMGPAQMVSGASSVLVVPVSLSTDGVLINGKRQYGRRRQR